MKDIKLNLNKNEFEALAQSVLYPFLTGNGVPRKDWDTLYYKVHKLVEQNNIKVYYNDYYENHYKPLFNEIEKQLNKEK